MTIPTHTSVGVEVLALGECAQEDCDHEDGCPTTTATACLECNTARQGTSDVTEWEGPVAACAVVSSATEDKSRTHCKECREGKHGACDGSMYVEEADVFEVCGCAAYDWNGEHTAGGGHG